MGSLLHTCKSSAGALARTHTAPATSAASVVPAFPISRSTCSTVSAAAALQTRVVSVQRSVGTAAEAVGYDDPELDKLTLLCRPAPVPGYPPSARVVHHPPSRLLRRGLGLGLRTRALVCSLRQPKPCPPQLRDCPLARPSPDRQPGIELGHRPVGR